MLHPAHLLRNTLALVRDRYFKVEQGEFGLRVLLLDHWSTDVANYMSRHSIRELRINYNSVKRISVGNLDFLAQLPDLEGLVVIDHNIKDYSPIEQLKGLRSLNIGCGITNGKHTVSLLSLPNLVHLYLSEHIPNQQDVFSCIGLKRLGLTKFPGKVSSEPFSALTNLEYLSLAACGLREVNGLSDLYNLEEINFGLMKYLSSLEGLKTLPKLRKVALQSCPNLGSIESFKAASNLEFLWLYDCGKIQSLSPLENCLKLQEINIGGNTSIQDGDFSILKQLPNLKRIGIASVVQNRSRVPLS